MKSNDEKVFKYSLLKHDDVEMTLGLWKRLKVIILVDL